MLDCIALLGGRTAVESRTPAATPHLSLTPDPLALAGRSERRRAKGQVGKRIIDRHLSPRHLYLRVYFQRSLYPTVPIHTLVTVDLGLCASALAFIFRLQYIWLGFLFLNPCAQACPLDRRPPGRFLSLAANNSTIKHPHVPASVGRPHIGDQPNCSSIVARPSDTLRRSLY